MKYRDVRRALRWHWLVAAALLLAPAASATPNFPAVMRGELQLSYEPGCALCHNDGMTGKNTANTPFANTLRSRGLVGYDEASLKLALTAISAEKKDSDGDGVIDVDELKKGTDPSVSASAVGEEPAEYGCSSAPTPATSANVTVAGLVVLLVVAAIRKMRAVL